MVIVFVCQSGELEAKASLLAASLRHTLGESVRLIAGVPHAARDWGSLASDTDALLDALRVEKVHITQPFGRQYPIANKIAALSQAPSAALLLDSDVICVARPAPKILDLSVMVAAKPADFLTCRLTDTQWTSLYDGLNLKLPAYRVATTVSLEDTLPYFNAGVVYSRDPHLLATHWMAICEQICDNPLLRDRRHWLDQIALPLAIHRLGWICHPLSEAWNFPAHRRQLSATDTLQAFFVHYHRLSVLMQQPALHAIVRELVEAYPELRCIIEQYMESSVPRTLGDTTNGSSNH